MKRKLTVIAVSLLAAIAISGCQSNSAKKETTAAATSAAKASPEQMEYEKALAAAKAAQKKAAGVNGAWNPIGGLLKKADASAKAGDYAAATKTAKKAEWQANTGYQQAMEQKNAGNPPYMK